MDCFLGETKSSKLSLIKEKSSLSFSCMLVYFCIVTGKMLILENACLEKFNGQSVIHNFKAFSVSRPPI